jgi:hypothetical protein
MQSLLLKSFVLPVLFLFLLTSCKKEELTGELKITFRTGASTSSNFTYALYLEAVNI